MATPIVVHSSILVNYLMALGLELSKPQSKHSVNLVDALILLKGRQTVCRLARKLLKGRTIFFAWDFFTYSPWLPIPCGSGYRPSCYAGRWS